MNEKNMQKILLDGENEKIEFKKSTAQLERALKAVCGFLNHKGGTIFFGIDDGKIVGQEVSDSTLKSISQKIRQRIKPEISPEIKVTGSKGKKVIEVKIKKGNNKPYYLNSIAYKRVGSETPAISTEELERIILKKNKKYWDSEICKETSLDDIDEEKVMWFLRKAKYERKFDVDEETSVKDVLERLELMKNGKFSNAAILLFGKDPQKFFLQAETRCARFKGTEPLEFIDMKVFGRSIINQRDDAVEFIKEHIMLHAKIVGTERKETWEYPIEAIREGITNAICHRDYEIASNVQIRIFDDRIEIWGSGSLPKPLTPEDLKRGHKSILRNPLIGKCFFLIKFVEEWGTGTNRILEHCQKHGLPEPFFEEIAGDFVVTFRKYHITDELMEKLPDNERRIIVYIKQKSRISRKECVELLDISPVTAFRQFKALENKRLIKKEGAGKNIYYVLL